MMSKTVRISTSMRGFQNWINRHPRQNLRGFFSINGRELTHNEVKRVVAYAVEKGYETEADIPSVELAKLLNNESDIY